MSQSEVARLREQIKLEYEASQRIFTDFTPTARHDYVTKCQENMGACYEELTRYMSAQEAIALVAETLNTIQLAHSSLYTYQNAADNAVSTKKEALTN